MARQSSREDASAGEPEPMPVKSMKLSDNVIAAEAKEVRTQMAKRMKVK